MLQLNLTPPHLVRLGIRALVLAKNLLHSSSSNRPTSEESGPDRGAHVNLETQIQETIHLTAAIPGPPFRWPHG